MERKRKRFDEERLSWRAWSADADALPAEWQVSPVLRETLLGMREGIQQAIADAERADAPSYEIVRGQLLAIIGGRSTYQFYLKKDADLEAQTTVFAMIPQQEGEDRKIEARVVSKVELEIRLATRELLPEDQLEHLVLIEDTTWLLKRQLHALARIQEAEIQMGAKTLGLLPTHSGVQEVRGKLGTFVPNASQKQAIAHGLGSERTFIVGPGGTGKTVTTSDLICRCLLQGLSVLLVSHTNIATDNAFLDVVHALLASNKPALRLLVERGLIVRQGTPHHLELLKGEYRGLTVEALAEQRMGAQAAAREQAEKTRQNLLQQIERLEREMLQQEHAWQPRREELEQKSSVLFQSMLRLRKEQEERAREQQRVSDARAKARKEASKLVEPLHQKRQQLLAARQSWQRAWQQRTEAWQAAQAELTLVHGMGRVRRFFSPYAGYDFAAAARHVAQLLQEQETAVTTLAAIDQQIQANMQARFEPESELARLTMEEHRWQNYLASFVDPAVALIAQQERELEQIQKALAKGESSLIACRTQLEQRKEEQARIEAQLEELKAEQEALRTQIVAEAQLVTTTVTGVYVNPRLLEREFDVVVIDELSMISLVSVLLVATRAARMFVGSGDPTQLSPVLKLAEPKLAPLAQEWLGKNLYTHLGITIRDAINGEKDCVLLTEQGRMHPVIVAPINTYVYEGVLSNREETKRFPPRGPYSDWRLMLVDSSGSGACVMKPDKHTARVNTVHVDIDVALVRLALADLPSRLPGSQLTLLPRIGVLTPYRSQANLIRRKLREAKLLQDVHVGTINTVQSLEFEIVIFDVVEAPADQPWLKPWPFTFDAVVDDRGMVTEATRLLNVAHTRARYKLIYVAHREWLHQHQPRNPQNVRALRRLLVDLVDGAYEAGHVSAEEILGRRCHFFDILVLPRL